MSKLAFFFFFKEKYTLITGSVITSTGVYTRREVNILFKSTCSGARLRGNKSPLLRLLLGISCLTCASVCSFVKWEQYHGFHRVATRIFKSPWNAAWHTKHNKYQLLQGVPPKILWNVSSAIAYPTAFQWKEGNSYSSSTYYRPHSISPLGAAQLWLRAYRPFRTLNPRCSRRGVEPDRDPQSWQVRSPLPQSQQGAASIFDESAPAWGDSGASEAERGDR